MSSGFSVRKALWNGTEHRLRAPFRLLLGVVLIALGAVGTALVGISLEIASATAGPVLLAISGTILQVAVYVGLAAGILAAAWLVDRRTLGDLGLGVSPTWWTDFAFGLALGVVLPGIVFLLELALGYVEVTDTLVARSGSTVPPAADTPVWLAFALTAGYFVAVGYFEELLFRGYLLTNVAEGLRGIGTLGIRDGLAIATAATSVLFGLVHATNPHATALAVVSITLYGMFLAAGYLLTGRIAVPVGIHVAWNLSVSSVYGFPVSGVTTPVTLVAVEQSGPPLVTGGAFGPEGGLISLVGLVAGGAALVAWIRWREGAIAAHSSVAIPDLREAGDESQNEEHAENHDG